MQTCGKITGLLGVIAWYRKPSFGTAFVKIKLTPQKQGQSEIHKVCRFSYGHTTKCTASLVVPTVVDIRRAGLLTTPVLDADADKGPAVISNPPGDIGTSGIAQHLVHGRVRRSGSTAVVSGTLEESY